MFIGRSLQCLFPFLLLVVGLNFAVADEPVAQAVRDQRLPTAAEARQQAEVLHESLQATLQAVHHHYYVDDEGLAIPAAALKDVFRRLERDRKLEIRWLVVNAQAMNVDHESKTVFEKAAVKALAAGQDHVEQTDGGFYRHVGPIVLQSECLKCHLPTRRSNKDRLAGLLIAIPVTMD